MLPPCLKFIPDTAHSSVLKLIFSERTISSNQSLHGNPMVKQLEAKLLRTSGDGGLRPCLSGFTCALLSCPVPSSGLLGHSRNSFPPSHVATQSTLWLILNTNRIYQPNYFWKYGDLWKRKSSDLKKYYIYLLINKLVLWYSWTYKRIPLKLFSRGFL